MSMPDYPERSPGLRRSLGLVAYVVAVFAVLVAAMLAAGGESVAGTVGPAAIGVLLGGGLGLVGHRLRR
jgi:hypothetical protein